MIVSYKFKSNIRFEQNVVFWFQIKRYDLQYYNAKLQIIGKLFIIVTLTWSIKFTITQSNFIICALNIHNKVLGFI